MLGGAGRSASAHSFAVVQLRAPMYLLSFLLHVEFNNNHCKNKSPRRTCVLQGLMFRLCVYMQDYSSTSVFICQYFFGKSYFPGCVDETPAGFSLPTLLDTLDIIPSKAYIQYV